MADAAARALYPVVFFDALRVKIRDEGVVRSKAVYLALAVLPDGTRDILGIWIEQTEGAKFWLKVFTDLKVRGCEDILIAVTDGLKGMTEALERRVSHDDAADLRRASHSQQSRPGELERAQGARGGPAADLHRRQRGGRRGRARAVRRRPLGPAVSHDRHGLAARLAGVIPFFAFPPEVRRVVYTTNALESVHARVRKIIKTRGHFPSDDAATKLIWLALRNITADWGRPAHHWRAAMNQFAILYEDRFTIPRA